MRIRHLRLERLVDVGIVAFDAVEPHGTDRGHWHVDAADELAIVDQAAVDGAEGGVVLLGVAAVEDEAGAGEGKECKESE